MLEDAEHLVRQVIFGNAVVVIQSRLSAPANIKRGLGVRLRPIHDLREFLPIIHFLERHLLHGRAGDDETVEFFVLDLIEGGVVIQQMFRVCVLGFVGGGVQECDLHLKRRVGKQPQDLRFGGDLGRHEVQDRNTQGADVLMQRTVFVHDEDIFVLEGFPGGKGGRDFYRHVRSDEGGRMKDEFSFNTFILPPSSFILMNLMPDPDPREYHRYLRDRRRGAQNRG